MTQDYKLSEFFWYSEAVNSETATRLGIDNTPTAAILDNIKSSAVEMDKVRRLLGKPVFPSSVYRCEKLEKVLTKKDYLAWCARRSLPANAESWKRYFAGKAHPRGWAWDFTSPGFGSPRDIVAAIRASDIKFDQIIMEGTWVHASFAPEMRMISMNATFTKDGTPVYTQA